MAGAKGGGSWKVAYADFVTAMMAFFLVMWIGAQDVKVRQSVANYFVDPSGVNKKPVAAGAVLNEPVAGSTPKEVGVGFTTGTKAPSAGQPSPSTAAVINWIRGDTTRFQRWREKAQQCRADAAALQEAGDESKTPEKRATKQLSDLLQSELTKNIPKDTPKVYEDLIFGSFKEVNWEQVAEDIMRA